MNKPTLQQLYALEAAIEPAFQKLIADTTGKNVYLEFSDVEKNTPFIEIRLHGLKPKGTRILPDQDETEVAHIWEGILTTSVVTQRGNNSNEQAELVGAVRVAAIACARKLDLPFHAIARILPFDSPRGIDPESGLDRSDVQHQIVIAIRPEAFPG